MSERTHLTIMFVLVDLSTMGSEVSVPLSILVGSFLFHTFLLAAFYGFYMLCLFAVPYTMAALATWFSPKLPGPNGEGGVNSASSRMQGPVHGSLSSNVTANLESGTCVTSMPAQGMALPLKYYVVRHGRQPGL